MRFSPPREVYHYHWRPKTTAGARVSQGPSRKKHAFYFIENVFLVGQFDGSRFVYEARVKELLAFKINVAGWHLEILRLF